MVPGSGKSTLARSLNVSRGYYQINGDSVRRQYNDWDFSIEGRIRQAKRIKIHTEILSSPIYVVDFIAPLKQMRDIIDADYTIFMDTIVKSRYPEYSALFEYPEIDEYNQRITNFSYKISDILTDFDQHTL